MLRCLIRKANFSKGRACERKVRSISGVTAAETKCCSCCQVRAKVRDHSPLFCPVWSSPFVSQCRHGIVPSPLALRTKITLWNSCLDFFSLIVKGGSIAEVHSLMSRWTGGNRCTALKILHMLKRICLMVFPKSLQWEGLANYGFLPSIFCAHGHWTLKLDEHCCGEKQRIDFILISFMWRRQISIISP